MSRVATPSCLTTRRTARPLRLAALLLALVLGLLVVPGLPTSLATKAFADNSATTVTGGWHSWNPMATNNGDGTYTGAYTQSTPSVTVSQTQNLVDQVVHVSWTNFTPSNDDITYVSDPPHPGVTPTEAGYLYPVEVLECTSSVPSSSPIGQPTMKSCYTGETTPGSIDGGHGQNNAVLAVTQPDGTGSVDFHVENKATNDLLGCDQTHACSLVVVPNNGGIQSNDGTTSCDDHSQDFLGPPFYDQQSYASVNYHGGQCAWNDRIVVPIHFAPLASDCPITGNAFQAVGSPMLERGFNQLIAGWCRGSGAVNFGYNSTTDEYQARSLFTAGSGGLGAATDVALVTQPADPTTAGTKKFTYAPIGNNAITIPYYVDNTKTGLPMTDLVLDARLVAKLLTQSYRPNLFNCTTPGYNPDVEGPNCDPNDAGNPASIFDDPEFQRLNFNANHPDRSYFPSNVQNGNQDSYGGFYPTVVAGNSDMTYELTRWIESDPDARAFLAGQPDQWGMHVNTAYLQKDGAQLYPTSQFQPLDPGWSYNAKTSSTVVRFMEGFQGTWNPLTGLPNVAVSLVAGLSTTQASNGGKCSVQPDSTCLGQLSMPVNFPKVPAELQGVRDLWGVTDSADDAAFDFPTAALVNSAGNAVAPTTRSMSDALARMKTNPDKITQYVDHSAEASDGYPLTEAVYAMVPTCGLTAAKAAGISSMLNHVADSQNYGVQPGTLAPGMLALSSAQLAQTRAAARAVSSQSCTSTPPDNTIGGRTNPHTGGGPGSHAGGGPAGNGNPGGGQPRTGNGSPSSTPNRPGSGSPTPQAGPSSSPAAKNLGLKPAAQNGSISFMGPLILIVGLVFLLAAPLIWLLTATAAGRGAVSRMRFW